MLVNGPYRAANIRDTGVFAWAIQLGAGVAVTNRLRIGGVYRITPMRYHRFSTRVSGSGISIGYLFGQPEPPPPTVGHGPPRP